MVKRQTAPTHQIGLCRLQRKCNYHDRPKNNKNIEISHTQNNVDGPRQALRMLESLYVKPCMHSPLGEGRDTGPAT